MHGPSRANPYTAAVLDELEQWLHDRGGQYRCASADPPTVTWDLPQHGTTRRRCWRFTFGCNPRDLGSWRVELAERDQHGNVYDTAETTAARGHLRHAAESLLEGGLTRLAAPSSACRHGSVGARARRVLTRLLLAK